MLGQLTRLLNSQDVARAVYAEECSHPVGTKHEEDLEFHWSLPGDSLEDSCHAICTVRSL